MLSISFLPPFSSGYYFPYERMMPSSEALSIFGRSIHPSECVEGVFCEVRTGVPKASYPYPSRKGHYLRLPWVWELATDKPLKGGTYERHGCQVPGGTSPD